MSKMKIGKIPGQFSCIKKVIKGKTWMGMFVISVWVDGILYFSMEVIGRERERVMLLSIAIFENYSNSVKNLKC